METREKNEEITPPRLIHSLTSGFNTIVGNIYIIAFPIVLDLLFWFGPRIRLKRIVTPILEEIFVPQPGIQTPDMVEMITLAREIWILALDQINILYALRTFPVGISSLLYGSGSMEMPIGAPTFYEVPSFTSAIFLYLIFSVVGIIIGSIYFSIIARSFEDHKPDDSLNRQIHWHIGQMFIMTITIIIFLFFLSIPVTLILSLIALISPVFSQIAILVFFMSTVWLALPLIFSPHGIFADGKNFLQSIIISAQVVKVNFSGTGLFILTLFILNYGLSKLWNTPLDSSWLKIIGITGHAFISTGVIAASFIFYRDGIRWLEEVRSKFSQPSDK